MYSRSTASAVFADTRFGGIGIVGANGIFSQLLIQIVGIAATFEKTVGLRANLEDEIVGLDISQHDQQGYSL